MTTDITKALHMAEIAGRIMLENGAETYRAEETVEHICQALGYPDVRVLVIPTGVLLTLQDKTGESHSSVVRVSSRSLNLDHIHQANIISRRAGLQPVEESIAQLEAIGQKALYPSWIITLAATLCSGCFALVFGGGLIEFLISSLAGLLASLLGKLLGTIDNYQVISNLFSGMVIALTSLVSTHFLCMGDYNIIIAGAVLPLLPGLAMTVAIRDTMRGDLVSGVARIAEALLSAACVAVGVGSILGLWLAIGGSLA